MVEAEGASASAGPSVSMRAVPSQDAYPRVATYVAALRKPQVRCCVVLPWLTLSLAGLSTFPRLLPKLEADVPPVKGTPSYEAMHNLAHYFPGSDFTAAFLVEAVDNSPLLSFINSSTATCILDHNISEKSRRAELRFGCKPKDQNALGGGCFTKQDMVQNITDYVQNITNNSLPAKGYFLEEFLNRELPNVTLCPAVALGQSALTEAWLAFADSVNSTMYTKFPSCDYTMLSFGTFHEESIAKSFEIPVLEWNISLSFTIPAGELWQLAKDQLTADSLTKSLVAITVKSCDGVPLVPASNTAKDIVKELQDVGADAPRELSARVNCLTLLLDAIQEGIQETMQLSSLTLPVALLVLSLMVRNVRLVLCTIINLSVCLASALFCIFPIASYVTVSSTAPSLMVATALAMSIDYSLFLLTRFQGEIISGRSVDVSVTIMLATSGKIVVVSGLTLMICFIMMLCIPVSLISSMGISAAITVFMAVAAALTLTPVLLLSFPRFFGATRRYGLSREGCCCACRRCRRRAGLGADGQEPGTGASETGAGAAGAAAARAKAEAPELEGAAAAGLSACWLSFGERVQRFAPLVFVALLAVALPVALTSLPQFKYSYGLVPLMPSNADATNTLRDLQDTFGVGAVFPTGLLLVPAPGAVAADHQGWSEKACQALQDIAVETGSAEGAPPFTASAFTGAMILNGKCSTLPEALGLAPWSHVDGEYSATQVLISYQVDTFSLEGQTWVVSLREAIQKHADIGTWHVTGEGPAQMDVANKTFASFPLMIALIMFATFAVLGLSFRSLVAPLRGVLCLLWMLVIAFGFAIFTFQSGCLDFLGVQQIAERQAGAMNWLSPCIAFSVLVGLGLDYDIFYSERVVEECEHGYSEGEAAVRALAATANTISAAGLIMVIAFASLLFSSTPTLNEIAFLLVVGILVDCFVTTKIIIPAVMGPLGRFNFWPQSFARADSPHRRATSTGLLENAAC